MNNKKSPLTEPVNIITFSRISKGGKTMLTLNYSLQFPLSIAWKPWTQALCGARCCTDTEPGSHPNSQSSQGKSKKGISRKVGFLEVSLKVMLCHTTRSSQQYVTFTRMLINQYSMWVTLSGKELVSAGDDIWLLYWDNYWAWKSHSRGHRPCVKATAEVLLLLRSRSPHWCPVLVHHQHGVNPCHLWRCFGGAPVVTGNCCFIRDGARAGNPPRLKSHWKEQELMWGWKELGWEDVRVVGDRSTSCPTRTHL